MSTNVFCDRQGVLVSSDQVTVPGLISVGRGDAFLKSLHDIAEERDGKLYIPGVADAHLDEEAGLLIAVFAAKVKRAMPKKLPLPAREAA